MHDLLEKSPLALRTCPSTKRSRSVRAGDRAEHRTREIEVIGTKIADREREMKRVDDFRSEEKSVSRRSLSDLIEARGRRDARTLGRITLGRGRRVIVPFRCKKSERQLERENFHQPDTRAGVYTSKKRSAARRRTHSHTSGSTRKTLSSREQTRWAEKLAAQVSNRNESAMVSGV